MKRVLHFLLGTSALLALNAYAAAPDVRLYTLNCGYINVHDNASFSDTDYYSHTPTKLADPCFLVKHNNDWLLWDLGLGDQYVGHVTESSQYGVSLIVPVSLADQLKALKLAPNDIKYVAVSHAHFDHTGNISLFPHSTLLMQRKEYASIQNNPPPMAVKDSLYSYLETMPKKLLDHDYDVFGDGSVLIIRTPGHTPGHQSLQLQLAKSGVVVLSGDVYHSRAAYRYKLVPVFNANRADTLASMERIDGILKNTKGRLIIQHDIGDFASLPKSPEYLQ